MRAKVAGKWSMSHYVGVILCRRWDMLILFPANLGEVTWARLSPARTA